MMKNVYDKDGGDDDDDDDDDEDDHTGLWPGYNLGSIVNIRLFLLHVTAGKKRGELK